MTNLTTKQIEQAQDLIEKYGFCTLETQKELAEAGFFEKVKVNFSIRILNSLSMNQVELCLTTTPDSLGIFNILPMPQMHEVWKILPKEIEIGGDVHYLHLYLNIAGYLDNANDYADGLIFDTNIMSETEAMCRLWLKLHKENLL